MTQLKCPECGKEFNETEQACPNCGCPVDLMTINSPGKPSKSQNRMVALAIPIGIMALLMVLDSVFDLVRPKLNIEMSNSLINVIGTLLGIITFILLFVWFSSLYKGSVKKSKMKKISLIALIGIGCYLFVGFFWLWFDLTLFINEKEGMTLFNGWRLVVGLFGLLKFTLFGGAFCALNGFFKGRMKTYALIVGILFLFRGLLFGVLFFIGLRTEFSWVLGILSYILMALFFFGFSKINK